MATKIISLEDLERFIIGVGTIEKLLTQWKSQLFKWLLSNEGRCLLLMFQRALQPRRLIDNLLHIKIGVFSFTSMMITKDRNHEYYFSKN